MPSQAFVTAWAASSPPSSPGQLTPAVLPNLINSLIGKCACSLPSWLLYPSQRRPHTCIHLCLHCPLMDSYIGFSRKTLILHLIYICVPRVWHHFGTLGFHKHSLNECMHEWRGKGLAAQLLGSSPSHPLVQTSFKSKPFM